MAELDLVIYINLDNRVDRRDEMEAEFKKVNLPQEKILRWSATRLSKNVLVGCSMSHIAVLEYIQTLPDSVQNILILEDDVEFRDEKVVKTALTEFLQLPRDQWNMALLSYTVLQREDYNDLVSVTKMAQLASSYLINRSFLSRLLANFREGVLKLDETKEGHLYAVDVYWWKVMQDGKTFYFNTPLARQRKSYSNLAFMILDRDSTVKPFNQRIVDHHKGLLKRY